MREPDLLGGCQEKPAAGHAGTAIAWVILTRPGRLSRRRPSAALISSIREHPATQHPGTRSRRIAWGDCSLSVMNWINLGGPVGRSWSGAGQLGAHSALLGRT